MNLASLAERNLTTFGECDSLVFEGHRYTNLLLHERALRLARALHDLKVVPGDRVGVLLPNSPDVMVVYEAVLRTGGVILPMLFLLAVPEIRAILSEATPKILFTSPEFLPNVSKALEGLARQPRIVLVGDPAPADTLALDELIKGRTADYPMASRDDSDLAVLVFTGGTTGKPKGVMLTHGNMLSAAEMVNAVVPTGPQDVGLSVLPLAHLFGLASLFVAQLFGCPTVIVRWFSPEGFMAAVQEHRVTTTAVVPTMISMMLNHPAFNSYDLSSLSTIVIGAAPVPMEVAAEFERRTNCRLLEAYGMTETTALATITRPDGARKEGSCGLPYPRTQIKIVGDDGTEVPPKEHGEICVKGPQVMTGYYKNAEATSAVLEDGWMHSGDIGHVDENGYLYVTERLKDLIIRAGFNIYPRDVEDVLYRHPSVAEAAVVGMPSEEFGEEVKAFVVLREGSAATEEEIHAFCRQHLAKYKTPRSVVFLSSLPKSPIGKVIKKDLRTLARQETNSG